MTVASVPKTLAAMRNNPKEIRFGDARKVAKHPRLSEIKIHEGVTGFARSKNVMAVPAIARGEFACLRTLRHRNETNSVPKKQAHKPEGRPKGTAVLDEERALARHRDVVRRTTAPLGAIPNVHKRGHGDRAHSWAQEHRDELDVPAAPTTTAEEYDADTSAVGLWFKARIADGVARSYSTTRDKATHWRLYLQPILGTGSPKTWNREQFRKIPAALDAKIQADELSRKPARNVWATATKMASDACESKVSALLVRDDDPAFGRARTGHGRRDRKQFLYPAELPLPAEESIEGIDRAVVKIRNQKQIRGEDGIRTRV